MFGLGFLSDVFSALKTDNMVLELLITANYSYT